MTTDALPYGTPAHDLYRQQIEDALTSQAIGFDPSADTRCLHTLLVALGDCAPCWDATHGRGDDTASTR